MRTPTTATLALAVVFFANVAAAQDGTAVAPQGYGAAVPAPPVVYVVQQPPAVVERVPTRSGFTMELGLGIGHMSVPSADFSEFGVAGLTLSLGGFLTPDLALMFRGTGVAVPESGATIVGIGALGVLQYWATDRLTLGGGLGFSQLSLNFDGDVVARSRTGFALNLRVGYALAQFTHHSLGIIYEITPAWIDGDSLVMQGLAFNWQWH